jgi:hypothetical protein
VLRFALPVVLTILALVSTASALPLASPPSLRDTAPNTTVLVDVRVQSPRVTVPKQRVSPRSNVRNSPAVRRQSTTRQRTSVPRQAAPRVAPRYRQPTPVRRHYTPGGQYRSAPRGWHQYGSRPRNWQTRGCILVVPFWFCRSRGQQSSSKVAPWRGHEQATAHIDHPGASRPAPLRLRASAENSARR